jgi:hypothetical protein
VLSRNPLDLSEPAARLGVVAEELVAYGNRSPRGDACLQYDMARFDPVKPGDNTHARWAGVSPEGRYMAAEILTLEGLRAPDAGTIAAWGMSGGSPLKTFELTPIGTNTFIVARWRQKVRTPYLTVFAADFSEVLWSGLTPRCRVAGVAKGPAGLVVASAFRPEWQYEFYECLAAPGAGRKFGGGYADGHIMLLEGPK